jgi:transposase-like protein
MGIGNLTGDTFFIDEVFVKINGKQHYLWRAVDQVGEVVDVFPQAKRDGAAAKRFFKRLLRSHGGEPREIVTNLGRHLVRAEHYRNLRVNAFEEWSRAVA